MPAFDSSAYAFTTIETYMSVGGVTVPVAGIKSIKYDDDLSRADVYGTGMVQIGMTQGKYKAQGTLTFYKRAFVVAFINQAGPGWRQVPLNLVVSYGPNGLGETNVDTIPLAYAGKSSADNSEGDEPLANELGLFIPQPILWNGNPSVVETFPALAVA
jgi:hypothetical protein